MVLGGVFEMIEMKPVGFISETAKKQISSGGYEGVNLRAQEGSLSFQGAWGKDIPLYTADQLAEAVAAERERCAKVCEAAAPKCDYSILGNVGDALNHAAEAIRSAAK